jgi:hypothetical protein
MTAEPVAQYLDALAGQSGSTVGVHLTATKRLAQAAALTRLLPASAVAAVTGVKAPRGATSGVGNWLTPSQARELLGSRMRPPSRSNTTAPFWRSCLGAGSAGRTLWPR